MPETLLSEFDERGTRSLWKKRLLWFSLLPVLAAFAVLFHDSLIVAHWVGRFLVNVRIESDSSAQVSEVWYDTTSPVDVANLTRQNPRYHEVMFQRADAFDGQTFSVHVTTFGATSNLERELAYHQDQLLVVRVDYVTGESRLGFAEIPDGKGRREVTVVQDPPSDRK